MTTRATTDALRQLSDQGVAIWLDDLSRERLSTGNLQALVDDRHVVGVTSNPTIFQTAITKSTAYDDQLRTHAQEGSDADTAVRDLTTDDVRAASTAGSRWRSILGWPTTPTPPSRRHTTCGRR
jgi:transaldolase